MRYNFLENGVWLVSIDDERIILKPGIHQLDKAQWNKLIDHPEVLKKLASNKLQAISQTDEPLEKVIDISQFDMVECQNLIRGIFDEDTLRQFMKQEAGTAGGRESIKALINHQIQAVGDMHGA